MNILKLWFSGGGKRIWEIVVFNAWASPWDVVNNDERYICVVSKLKKIIKPMILIGNTCILFKSNIDLAFRFLLIKLNRKYIFDLRKEVYMLQFIWKYIHTLQEWQQDYVMKMENGNFLTLSTAPTKLWRMHHYL